MLQRLGYVVTTTDPALGTFETIAAARPDAVVADLGRGEPSAWDLLERLAGDPRTAGIALVVTAVDPALLAQAQDVPHLAGGRFLLARPLDPALLADVVHALIGPAGPTAAGLADAP